MLTRWFVATLSTESGNTVDEQDKTNSLEECANTVAGGNRTNSTVSVNMVADETR